MSKSWAYGACTVLGVHALWFGLIFLESREDWFMGAIVMMSFVTLNVAGLGAFITAMAAPRRGFLLGLSMAPLSAGLSVAANLLFAATGNRVDLSGFYANFGLFTVLLAYGVFVSAVGGGIGRWLARKPGPEPAPGPALAPPAGHI